MSLSSHVAARLAATVSGCLLTIASAATVAGTPAGASTHQATRPGSAATSLPAWSAPATGTAAGGSWRSPVYLMPLENHPPPASKIASIMSATGEKNFLLSFVLDSGNCSPRGTATAARRSPPTPGWRRSSPRYAGQAAMPG
jgi:hypothetical protein